MGQRYYSSSGEALRYHRKRGLSSPAPDWRLVRAASYFFTREEEIEDRQKSRNDSRTLSENARKKAEQFDWCVILPQWDALLTAVAEGRRP